MARTDKERKQISSTTSLVMTVLVALAVGYLGVTLLSFGTYALGEGETIIGIAALVLGGVFVAAVLAVVVSQVRAWLRARR